MVLLKANRKRSEETTEVSGGGNINVVPIVVDVLRAGHIHVEVLATGLVGVLLDFLEQLQVPDHLDEQSKEQAEEN